MVVDLVRVVGQDVGGREECDVRHLRGQIKLGDRDSLLL